MTKKQEDQLTMWSATYAVLEKYEDKWKILPAFANAAAIFRSISDEVNLEASTQQQDNTGVTIAKTAKRADLTERCKQTALNIKSYAINIKDFGLEKQFEFTDTYFERLRNNIVPVVADTIYLKAVELKNVLSDYGVGEEELAGLKTSMERYIAINPAPRLAKGTVKQATVNLADMIEEGTLQLKLMDNLLGNFNNKFPEFVSAFRNARIVINRSRSRKNKKSADDGDAK